MNNLYFTLSVAWRARTMVVVLIMLMLPVSGALAQGISGPTSVCPGTTQSCYFYSYGGNCGVSYWSASNGTVYGGSSFVSVQWSSLGGSGSLTAYYDCYDNTTGQTTYGSTTIYVSIAAPLKVAYMSFADGMGICKNASPYSPTRFNHPAVSGATSYTWTATNGLLINGSASSVTTTNTYVDVSAGSSTVVGAATGLTVTPNGGCGGNLSLTRQITIEDSPIPQSSIRIYKQGYSTTDNYMCPNTKYTIRVEAPTARLRSGWTVSGNYSSYYIGPDCVDVTTTASFSYLNIGVTVTNSCGQTTYLSQNFFQGYSCSSFTAAETEVNLFPNPATGGEVNVTWPASELVSSVELLNGSGQVLEKVKPAKGQAKLKLDKLVAGTYYVHLYVGEAVIRKQLIVKK